MKKALGAFLLGTLVFLLAAATAAANELPLIDDVLRDIGTAADRVEVGDDLSMYKAGNADITDFGSFRMIIVERRNPEKEFTARRYEAPFTGKEGFPDDYEGVDRGETRVWLRCDLMKQLPSYFRAGSMAEADLLVVAQNVYEIAGSVSVTDYEDGREYVLPDFDTVDEMEAYLAAHQPVVTAMTYYPKFCVCDEVIIYKIGTSESSYCASKRGRGKADQGPELCTAGSAGPLARLHRGRRHANRHKLHGGVFLVDGRVLEIAGPVGGGSGEI